MNMFARWLKLGMKKPAQKPESHCKKPTHKLAAEWFDDRKNQFATCFFLRNGVNGFGKVTSDPTENTMTVVMVQLVERMLASAHKQTELDTEWGSEGKELASHALSMLLVEL